MTLGKLLDNKEQFFIFISLMKPARHFPQILL